MAEMTNHTNDIKYIGVTDLSTDLFEGQYPVPYGITYNSYVILDEKIAVLDTTDALFTEEWLALLEKELDGRTPDYLIVHHMEPDHSAGIRAFAEKYPEAAIAASAMAFSMMKNFFGPGFENRQIKVSDGSVIELGRHSLRFISAPMVHWPEVMMSFDACSGTLFSADAFGRFGTPGSDCDPADEARRYYIGIVGKYGPQVQAVLKKASELQIEQIRPLHGPALKGEDVQKYIDRYKIWSSYEPEDKGTVIAYASVYGHTRAAAEKLADMLECPGGGQVQTFDLTRCDMSEAVAAAFRFDKTVFASVTYNGDIFPAMKKYILALTERGFQNRTAAFIENGSWAPAAAKTMKQMLQDCKNIRFAENTVRITSALDKASEEQLGILAAELS